MGGWAIARSSLMQWRAGFHSVIVEAHGLSKQTFANKKISFAQDWTSNLVFRKDVVQFTTHREPTSRAARKHGGRF